MANPNPGGHPRWKPGECGNKGRGAGRTKWLRGLLSSKFDKLPFARKLNLALRYGDENLRHAMAARLLEIAFTDEVFVIGRDQDGPIERASSRESVDAIKTLFAYDLGKPREMDAPAVSVGDIPTDGRPLLDIIADVYRARLLAGQMTEPELHKLTDLFLSIDRTKIALLIKLLGGNVAGKSEDEIRALLAGTPLPAKQVPTPAPNVVPAKDGEAEGARESEPSDCTISPGEGGKAPGSPSPKERDTAAHGSGCENGPTFAGADGSPEQVCAAEPSCFVTDDGEDDE